MPQLLKYPNYERKYYINTFGFFIYLFIIIFFMSNETRNKKSSH